MVERLMMTVMCGVRLIDEALREGAGVVVKMEDV